MKPRKLSTSKTLKTFTGNITAAEEVTIRDIRLPEFDKADVPKNRKLWFFMLGANMIVYLVLVFNWKLG